MQFILLSIEIVLTLPSLSMQISGFKNTIIKMKAKIFRFHFTINIISFYILILQCLLSLHLNVTLLYYSYKSYWHGYLKLYSIQSLYRYRRYDSPVLYLFFLLPRAFL